MPQTVRDWMSSPVVVIPPEMWVGQALTLMRRRGVHSLVVDLTRGRHTFGILTTTDIRDKIVGPGRDPAGGRVSEILSAPATFARPEWTLVQASVAMQELKVHQSARSGRARPASRDDLRHRYLPRRRRGGLGAERMIPAPHCSEVKAVSARTGGSRPERPQCLRWGER